jgi:hypothetical protein
VALRLSVVKIAFRFELGEKIFYHGETKGHGGKVPIIFIAPEN